MRLIDADKVIKKFADMYTVASGINIVMDRYAIKVINESPTIDAVEVVRCKDCKHSMFDAGALMECSLHEIYVINDDYCSYGERKE